MITAWSEASIAVAYLRAKSAVLGSPYAAELIHAVAERDVTESLFLREVAWVVMSAGMRESVVRSKFPGVSSSFLEWRCASAIVTFQGECVAAARRYFGHAAKLNSIVRAARIVDETGFESLMAAFAADPIATLRRFPYIGPVTAQHLAKNLGVKTAKADRHLVRISMAAGFSSVDEFCNLIAGFVGDDVRTVDAVFWRFATIFPNYLEQLFGPPHALAGELARI